MSELLGVYKAISGVAADMSIEGIAKDRKNQQQGYNFRGVDDVMNALSGKLTKHGLIILPRVTSRDVSERETRNGGKLFFTVLNVDYDLIAVSDGSKVTVSVVGEGMDSADKSVAKALSFAFKTACFQVFCIPVEGIGADAENDDHDLGKSKPAPAKTPPKPETPKPPAKTAPKVDYGKDVPDESVLNNDVFDETLTNLLANELVGKGWDTDDYDLALAAFLKKRGISDPKNYHELKAPDRKVLVGAFRLGAFDSYLGKSTKKEAK